MIAFKTTTRASRKRIIERLQKAGYPFVGSEIGPNGCCLYFKKNGTVDWHYEQYLADLGCEFKKVPKTNIELKIIIVADALKD